MLSKTSTPVRRRFAAFAVIVISLAIAMPVLAIEAPNPPCDGTSGTAYPEGGEAPLIHVWAAKDLPAAWIPPVCTGWGLKKYQLLVSLAGHFHYEQGAQALLGGFGAVSSLTQVRYWSVTEKRWKNLFDSSVALEAPDLARQRQDFTIEEMTSGRDFYFAENDNRSTNRVIYRLRMRKSVSGGFTVEMENVTAVKFYLFDVIAPGALQSVFFLEEEGPAEWNYYSLTRVGPGLSLFNPKNDSYINRALALFYHYAAIPKG